MANLFDLIDLDATHSQLTGGNGGQRTTPSIVRENNDRSTIAVDTASLGWDAGEYGMTRQQAIAMQLQNGGMERLKAAANRRANLATGKNGRVAFFGVDDQNNPFWHGLGTNISAAANSAEALQFADLAGWGLQKVQAYADFGDRRLDIPGCFAIVRGDTGAVLAHVGNNYQILDNESAFDFLNDIVDGTNTLYETAGALGAGERVWVLARMNKTQQIATRDECQPYALLSNSHDGTQAIQILPTNVRVCCQNTHRAALRAGRRAALSIRHTKNMRKNVEAARAALGLAQQANDAWADRARHLAKHHITRTEAVDLFSLTLDDVVDVTIAETRVTRASIDDGSVLAAIMEIRDVEQRQQSEARLEKARERRKDLLAEIIDRYEGPLCNGIDSIAGTAWSAVNAVSEAAEHGGLTRYKGTVRERMENRFNSVTNGAAQEYVTAAFNRAMEMAS